VRVPALLLTACLAAAAAAAGEFGDYWHRGEAEITSYDLEQARYGEIHAGHAVLIFVTEDFSRSKHVKLDHPDAAGDDAVKVLKLNFTKKFDTGVYPYSMMTSVFTPVELAMGQPTLKITTSSQEWCGHTFTQLDLRGEGYEAALRSYFESEGDRTLALEGAAAEDEIWNRIRLAPATLPVGKVRLIPGTMYQRLSHEAWRVQDAVGTLEEESGLRTYTLDYPELGRTLKIRFREAFPHEIESWEETHRSGFGAGARVLTTKGTLRKRILLPYWRHNRVEDAPWREALGLE
jgi:hypothetical protein